MVTAITLNQQQIEDGEKLLRQLDKANVHVNAALWFFFTEKEDWKLLLSLPDLSRKGPKTAYKEVQKALSKLKDIKISLYDVAITEPNDPLFHLLKTAIKTGPDAVSRIRFSRNVINGQMIEDAFIYRLS